MGRVESETKEHAAPDTVVNPRRLILGVPPGRFANGTISRAVGRMQTFGWNVRNGSIADWQLWSAPCMKAAFPFQPILAPRPTNVVGIPILYLVSVFGLITAPAN